MLCDIPRCEGGGVVEGVRSEKQEKVIVAEGAGEEQHAGRDGDRRGAQRVGLGNGGPG